LLLLLAALAACATSPRAASGPLPAPSRGADSTVMDSAGGDAPAAPAAAPLSPADSARVSLGSATVSIRYSRPAMRGRVIFGELVPYGQVWRTGANAATSLTTTAPITISGVAIPAGQYTLFSIPNRAATGEGVGSWELVVNRQTGQWGTEYHPEQDVARIPLTVSTLAEPVERFTIALEPQGSDRATLALEWERARGTADVVVQR
jgi:hypothetical protein